MCVNVGAHAHARAAGLQAEPDKRMRDLWAAERAEAERLVEVRRQERERLDDGGDEVIAGGMRVLVGAFR